MVKVRVGVRITVGSGSGVNFLPAVERHLATIPRLILRGLYKRSHLAAGLLPSAQQTNVSVLTTKSPNCRMGTNFDVAAPPIFVNEFSNKCMCLPDH